MTKLRALAGLLIAAILLYSGLWYTSAFQAEKDAAARLSALRDKGLRVDHGKIKLSGFPYRIVLTIDGLQIRTRGPGLDFGAESLVLVSHLWTPGHWVADAQAVQVSAANGALSFTDNLVRGSYRLHKDGTAVIATDTVSADDFVLTNAFGAKTLSGLSRWQLFLRLPKAQPAANNGLYESRFLDFKLVLTADQREFIAEGGLMGPTISDWTATELGAWRDGGGLLEFDKLMLTAGSSALTGNASLTLDDAFRPLGSASLKVSGAETINTVLKDIGVPIGQGLPQNGDSDDTLSLMLQLGTASLNGQPLIPLRPVVAD